VGGLPPGRSGSVLIIHRMPRLRPPSPAARLKGLWEILRGGSGLVLTAMVVTALAASLFAARNPTFTATSQVLLRPAIPPDSLKQIAATDSASIPPELDLNIATEAAVLESPVIAARVARALRLPTPAYVLSRSVETTVLTGFTVEVRARAADPRLAADLANSFADQYVAYRQLQAVRIISRLERNLDRRALQLRTRVGELEAELTTLDTATGDSPTTTVKKVEVGQEQDRLLAVLKAVDLRAATLKAFASLHTNGGDVVVRASEPVPGPVAAVAAAFGLGLGGILGAFLALLRHLLERTGETRQMIERVSGMQVLAVIPSAEERMGGPRGSPELQPTIRHQPESAATTAYRRLHAALVAKGLGRTIRRMLLVSTQHGDGRSVTAANLAIASADSGRPTLVISADSYDLVHHLLAGSPDGRHLTDGPGENVHWVSHLTVTRTQNLCLLAADRVAGMLPGDVLDPRLPRILNEAADLFNLVIVNTPLMLVDPQALPLAAQDIDAVLVVVTADAVDKEELAEAGQIVELMAAPLRAVVVIEQANTGEGL
jgi:Mrp family chromosome partitioning ATPase/capsular polysaccharide biosynthesis protein